MAFPLKTFSQAHAKATPRSWRETVAFHLWDYLWILLCRWTPKPFKAYRRLILRMAGAKLEGTPFVHQRARIEIPWNVTLKNGAAIGDRTHLYSLGEIEIGEMATLSQEVLVCTGTHLLDDPVLPLQTGKISIGPHAFIGARAILLPGVEIGAHAVVGAGAVVTKDIPPGEIWAGNPARKIGERKTGSP